jgi:nicotinic acetylcholine receptor
MTRPTTEKRRQSILQRHRLGDVQMHERMTTHSLLPNLLESEEEYRACAENGLCGLNTLGASDWIRQAQACNINMTQTSGDDTGSTKYVNDKSEFASPNLVAILVELKKITSKLKEDEEDTNIKNEWKFAAIVIDRLCLWICLAATLISTIAILSSAPHLVA